MTHPPAVRTFRYQSVRSPHGIGMTNPSPVGRATTGVRYALPDRRPLCSTTPYSGSRRVPASSITSGLNSRVAPRNAARERLTGAGAVAIAVDSSRSDDGQGLRLRRGYTIGQHHSPSYDRGRRPQKADPGLP